MKTSRTQVFLLFGLIAGFVYLSMTKSGREAAAKAGEFIMNLSNNALNVIKRFEGFSATPYPDAQGFSIGYGHFIKPGESFTEISEEQATELLRQDAANAAAAVRDAVTVPLTQNQFDALTSLSYNIGVTAFRNSSLVKKLNAGDYSAAAAQFAVWNKSQGKVLPVLVSRRSDEQSLFMTA